MKLNYKKSGSGKPLIILHGLFGMLDNWQTVAKALESHFTVYLIDQRNHGKSPHAADHNYTVLAADLKEFFEQQNIQTAFVLGHSMGGKTAMQFTVDFPDCVEKLMVVDMGIKRYPGGHDGIFDALTQFDPATVSSRSEAEEMLGKQIPNLGVRQFILKNMTRTPEGKYEWKFNWPALYNNYQSGILAPVVFQHPVETPALFIRGERSDYIPDSDWPDIHQLFPNAQLATVKNAGHWVHADQPQALIDLVVEFLSH